MNKIPVDLESVGVEGEDEPDLKQKNVVLYKEVIDDPFFKGISVDAVERVHKQLQVIEVGIKQTSLSWLLSGSSLTSIKEEQPHGDFGKWFSEKFDQTPRSAQHRMRAASLFEGKFELASSLAVQSLILLSQKKNVSVVEHVIKGLENGTKYRVKDVKTLIAETLIDLSGNERREKKLKFAHQAARALLEGEWTKDIGAVTEAIRKVDGKILVDCLLTELDALHKTIESINANEHPRETEAAHV